MDKSRFCNKVITVAMVTGIFQLLRAIAFARMTIVMPGHHIMQQFFRCDAECKNDQQQTCNEPYYVNTIGQKK